MKLLEFTACNFLSFGPEQKVDFSEVGMYLICGPNGVGKSTILDGVSFAFYGQPVRPINLPKVVNEQVQCNCKVGLKFEINGEIYWIDRYRKHDKYKDALRIYKGTYDDEGLISKIDIKDAQEQLNDIIKMNHKAFINTIMLSQEDISGFIESSPAKKKEVIESVLQLDSFTKYHKIAQDKRKQKKASVDGLTIDIKSNDKIMDNIKKSMEDYVESCKQQKQKDKATMAELKQKLSDLQEIDVNHEFQQIKLAKEAKEKKALAKSTWQMATAKVESLLKEISSIEDAIEEYNTMIANAKKRNKKTQSSIDAFIENKNKLIADIHTAEANPEQCPLCGGEVNVELHKKYINDKETEIISIESSCKDNLANIETENRSIVEWEQKISSQSLNLTDVKKNLELAKKEESVLKSKIAEIIIPPTKEEDELREISDTIKAVELKITALSNKEYVDINYINSSKTKLVEVIATIDKQKTELAALSKELLLLQFWEDSLSSKKNSIKSWCINNIIGYFNSRIKHYIDRFFEGKVVIKFDNELNEEIKYKSYIRDFKQFSGGQRRRLNIAILFALHSLVKANVSNKIDILFLDEVLSNFLDDEGISIVLNLLEDMKDNNESVWVIDHKDYFKNYPSFKKIEVSLDKRNFTHIKVG